SGDYRILKS
ncbi:hypothetical protein D046_4154B, partial [Vibrio parahaemolyticus V-223/04]